MKYISLIAAIVVAMAFNMAVRETGTAQLIGIMIICGWIGWVTEATTS